MISSVLSAPISELGGARLVLLEEGAIAPLAEAIVAIPPWSVMNYSANALARFLAEPDGGVRRYLVQVGEEPAGAVSVRFPWLKGPYLELLALLPSFQGRGIGTAIMDWFEQEGVRLGARNLWVCASSFNARAVRFYRRHGFREAAILGGLVADGYDEILLRKFPLRGARE
jgi:ribosomal protein S18 acetylase RimI-like enzyme